MTVLDFLLGPDLSIPYLVMVGAAVLVTALFVTAVLAVMLEDVGKPRDNRTLADFAEVRHAQSRRSHAYRPLHPIDHRPWVEPRRKP